MAKSLAKNVYIGSELYEAGSTPPKEIADQITNPKAWDDSDDAVAPIVGADEVADETPTRRRAAKQS